MHRTRAAAMFMTPCRRDALPQTIIRTGTRISKRYFSKTESHRTTGECPVSSSSVPKMALATNRQAVDRYPRVVGQVVQVLDAGQVAWQPVSQVRHEMRVGGIPSWRRTHRAWFRS